MANLGLFSSDNKSVTITFRIPYYTQWGQSLLVCGSLPLLGSWDVKRGLLLSPQHQGNELVWRGGIAIVSGFECEYSYYLVEDEKNVLRWEMRKKMKLLLSERAPHGVRSIWNPDWFRYFNFQKRI